MGKDTGWDSDANTCQCVCVCAFACVAPCGEGAPLRDEEGRGGLRRQPEGQGLRWGDPRGGRWVAEERGRRSCTGPWNWVV